jgi:hypothetical protein
LKSDFLSAIPSRKKEFSLIRSRASFFHTPFVTCNLAARPHFVRKLVKQKLQLQSEPEGTPGPKAGT